LEAEGKEPSGELGPVWRGGQAVEVGVDELTELGPGLPANLLPKPSK
jgi:hypothetical protein